jgi:rhodanese-related sulfurtransferase
MDKGFKKISHVEAKKIIDTENSVVILDVREPEEVREGYIDGAVFIPNGDILKKAGNVIPDKNKKILVYCRSGKRSRVACEKLIKIGYTNVYDFGGIMDWPFEIVM